jgi:uncharacterized protein YjaZ
MKNLLLILLVIILGLPVVSMGHEFVSFSLDKNIFENLSDTQQQSLIAKVSEYNQFFTNEVIPHIPTPVLNKIQDMHVTIHFSNESTRDGLFIPGDNSHEHKIEVQLIQLNSNGLKSLLAHEFFHAVHFELNPNEEVWAREGMAQLFEYVVTHELNGRNLQAAIANPYTPLIGEYKIDEVNAAQYGHDMLYFYYLYNHCGEDQLLWDLAEGQSAQKGAELINSILIKQNSKRIECQSFISSVKSFEVAKFHNQLEFNTKDENDRYYLAPTNLTPLSLKINSENDLTVSIKNLPLYSSLGVDINTWNSFHGTCANCSVFYVKKSFPYEVLQLPPADLLSLYKVILVKTKR